MNLKAPPMGWNSWDCYGASVNEKTVRQNAEYMAKNLKKYGYEYVVVDIQWYEPCADSHEYHAFADLHMDEWGRLIPAENRFPSACGTNGFKPLGDYIHSLGLKFGIHILRGIPRQAVHMNCKIQNSDYTARQIASPAFVCCWNSDMYGINSDAKGAADYYNSIFSLYSEWGVDFVKVDDIANHYAKGEIELIYSAIKNSGREMVLSISPGPTPYEQKEHLKKYVNMWRITDDFWDRWDLLYDMFGRVETWHKESVEGHFPDCDMLPVGAISQCYNKDNWTKFTEDEQKTMMSLWCVARSPLMIGAELTKLDAFTLDLLTNEELLKILKNSRNSKLLYRERFVNKEQLAWYTEGESGENYIAVFNAGEAPIKVSLDLNKYIDNKAKKAYEIWDKTEIDINGGILPAEINAHGVKLFKIKTS